MAVERQYSTWTAFIYMFNLTIGTGALAIPSILSAAGWILGSVFLVVIAILSFMAAAFIIESEASANAILRLGEDDEEERGETTPLLRQRAGDIFRITSRVELGEMAIMFFPAAGQILFYIALVSYLYGSTTVYATFVPISLVRFIVGGDVAHRFWEYDLCLLLFAAVVVPFSMKDFQSTKSLQMVTMAVRIVALSAIIAIATYLSIKNPRGAREIPLVDLRGVPNLFGGAIYSFMCQHSLPGIIAPMTNKTKEITIASFAFVVICSLYLSLFVSNATAFGANVESPITFNYSHYGWVGHLLVLFPVFTVSSSFPMMAITLRNNLSILIGLLRRHWRARKSRREHRRCVIAGTGSRGEAAAPAGPSDSAERHPHGEVAPATTTTAATSPSAHHHPSILLTLCATLPPIIFASVAHRAGIHVDSLVGFTGQYSGCAVMFIIPACLAIASRRRVSVEVPEGNPQEPHKAHPKNTSTFHFSGGTWPFLILAWSFVVISFDTLFFLFSSS